MAAFLERDKENTGKHLSYKLSQSSKVDLLAEWDLRSSTV